MINQLKKEYESRIFEKAPHVDRNDELNTKYANYIPQGWYGFDLGSLPDYWFEIIEKFTDYLVSNTQNFQIHQVKIKFGGLRYYVAFNPDTTLISYDILKKEISQLEDWLYHKFLVY